jgi:hypothetical protein
MALAELDLSGLSLEWQVFIGGKGGSSNSQSRTKFSNSTYNYRTSEIKLKLRSLDRELD